MRTRWLSVVIVTAYCAVAPARVHGQETTNFASVSGRVTDGQGAVVPGAHVSARQTETNVIAEALTNAEGRFRFPYLRVGTYEVKVHVDGFADTTRILRATVGAAFDIPLVLNVAGLETSVTVSGDPTFLEAARSQIAGTVPHAEIQNLPMNGRNFLDLALLVPGVSPTNIGSTHLSNNFIVDGLSANDDAAGLSGIPYTVDAVEQFQVVTSGGQAELGRALGGYVNVVTKSGTNGLRGALYDFIRDDNFNAPNALSGNTLPMNQQQYGGSLGGPVVRNRTFFFSNVERRLLDQTGLVTILPGNVPVINARLAAAGYPGSPVSTGIYPNPVHSANVLGKLDQASRLIMAGIALMAAAPSGGAMHDAIEIAICGLHHVYDGNVRDVAFSRSFDQGRTLAPAVRVSNDNWYSTGAPRMDRP